MKKILILHYEVTKNDRNTIKEHMQCFEKYTDSFVVYLNMYEPQLEELFELEYDLIVFHYTFLSQKWLGDEHFREVVDLNPNVRNLRGYKVALPQDEYVYSEVLCRFFKECQIDAIYTLCYPEDFDKVYPKEKTGVDTVVHTLAGYLDEDARDKIANRFYKPHKERSIDIGYRARKLPFWLGTQGTLKWKITEEFDKALEGTKLNYNISNDERDVFIGLDWYRFLADSRVILGSLGGASLHDPNGEVRLRVESYVAENPTASFEEVERECFPGLDNNLKYHTSSPRHFEACITKTCQVLVEGNYFNKMQPGRHYIELKRDFSNIDEVIEKIKDKELCELIAENAYREIAMDSELTYRAFAEEIVVRAVNSGSKSSKFFFVKYAFLKVKIACIRSSEALKTYWLETKEFFHKYFVRTLIWYKVIPLLKKLQKKFNRS